MEGPVGVRQLARSASIANNGMQYHCRTHAFNTRRSSKSDVTYVYSFPSRTFHTATCANDIRGETCHMSQLPEHQCVRYVWRSDTGCVGSLNAQSSLKRLYLGTKV